MRVRSKEWTHVSELPAGTVIGNYCGTFSLFSDLVTDTLLMKEGGENNMACKKKQAAMKGGAVKPAPVAKKAPCKGPAKCAKK